MYVCCTICIYYLILYQVYCFVMGGDLVDILSADEDKFIRNTLANIIDREGASLLFYCFY